ncbi:MAG TPA: PDDEXK nuclease domain-containing protein, partial [Dinghuibacter sp.]|uniref:PDDEXK nuclease domain-containing protein n=1 Tax=Dinghuibacter sp. TaxID=2024697 RepID=UPI002B632F90
MELSQHFEEIRSLIRTRQQRALQEVYREQLTVYWEVGAYVHHRLATKEWGDKTVDQLAEWLKKNDPAIKGFDRRSLYRMRDFYSTWHQLDWTTIKTDGSVRLRPGDNVEDVESQSKEIVVTVSPQFKKIPHILSALSWSHHVDLLSRTGSLDEKVFYLLLAAKEKYSLRDLRRQMASALFERQKLSKVDLTNSSHPNADIAPQIFRDRYIFDFLDLPEPHSEHELKKGLTQRLRQFVLEIGRDFTFMGEEYRLQVGTQDFFLDLLFYHRELQCLVAIELKTTPFQPEYIGKLNFYLEALDRDVKKPHENPSIGVLLCTEKSKEVVE